VPVVREGETGRKGAAVTDQVFAVPPPEAESITEYERSASPFPSVEDVITSGGAPPWILITNGALPSPSIPQLSVWRM